MTTTGNDQFDGFIARFTPEIAALAHALLAKLRTRIPGARLLVYDNYNALAIGFASGDKVKTIVMSVALYPRWISLFVSARLDDPHGLFEGSGTQVRSLRLATAETLDDPRVEAIIAQAIARAEPPIDPAAPGGIVIKSVSAKQRPRRPS